MPAETLVADLQSRVKGAVMALGVEGFADKVARWNLNYAKWFRFSVLCESVEDISTSIKFANEQKIPIVIYGGGHSLSGGSSTETGLVIDLRRMNNVRVDAAKKLLYVQGGALWSDVDIASSKHGLATVAGTVSHTGVGGLTVYGGYGWLSGRHGLACDNVVQATVVLADGRVVTASKDENPDLYWAIRGGGGNFGVVSEFVFQAHDQATTVWGGSLLFAKHQLPEFVKALDRWLSTRGRDEGAFVVVKRFADVMADFIPTGGVEVRGASVIFLTVFYNGSALEGRKKFAPFYDIKPIADLTYEMRYLELNSSLNVGAPHGLRRYFDPVTFKTLDLTTLQKVVDQFDSFFDTDSANKDAEENSAIMFEFLPIDKITSVPSSATPFGCRDKVYHACAAMTYLDPSIHENVKEVAQTIARIVVDSQGKNGPTYVYPNYADGRHRSETIYGGNYPRLQKIKARYDSEDRFHGPYPIVPAA